MNEINPKPEYWVLSLSGGKDSTALGLEWLARHKADPVTYPFMKWCTVTHGWSSRP